MFILSLPVYLTKKTSCSVRQNAADKKSFSILSSLVALHVPPKTSCQDVALNERKVKISRFVFLERVSIELKAS